MRGAGGLETRDTAGSEVCATPPLILKCLWQLCHWPCILAPGAKNLVSPAVECDFPLPQQGGNSPKNSRTEPLNPPQMAGCVQATDVIRLLPVPS